MPTAQQPTFSGDDNYSTLYIAVSSKKSYCSITMYFVGYNFKWPKVLWDWHDTCVLKHQYSLVVEKIFRIFIYFVCRRGGFSLGVWRVNEDDLELLFTGTFFEILRDARIDNACPGGEFGFCKVCSYCPARDAAAVNEDTVPGTSTQRLYAERAGPGEEIEHASIFDASSDHVEDCPLYLVEARPYHFAGRHFQRDRFRRTGNDSHNVGFLRAQAVLMFVEPFNAASLKARSSSPSRSGCSRNSSVA